MAAKKKTITKLKKDLWKVFAAYIKRRDRNICFTCNKYATGQAMHCGHYIAKAACGAEYYFSEFNNHAQCAGCNLRLEGNRPAYRKRIIEVYGMKVLKDLETNYHKPCPDYPYEEKIKHYKSLLNTN